MKETYDGLNGWVKAYTSALGKKTKVHSDYATIIRHDTPELLSKAVTQGLIDKQAGARLLSGYKTTVDEVAKRPFTDDNDQPIMYRHPVSGRVRPLMRNSLIDSNGNYNWQRSPQVIIDELNAKNNVLVKKQNEVTKEQKSLIGGIIPTTPEAGKDWIRGAGKSYLKFQGDVGRFGNKVKNGTMDLLGPMNRTGAMGEFGDPSIYEKSTPKVTPEKYGQTYYPPIENQAEAAGFASGESAKAIYPMLASMGLGGLTATGGSLVAEALGVSPQVGALIAGTGIPIAAGITSTLAKNPDLNPYNPQGIFEKHLPDTVDGNNQPVIGTYRQTQSEGADTLAPMVRPITSVATSIILASKGGNPFNLAKSTLSDIKSGVQNVKNVVAASKVVGVQSNPAIMAAALSHVPEIKTVAGGVGYAGANTLPMLVQDVAAKINPYNPKTGSGYEAPNLSDIMESIGTGLIGLKPQEGSLMHEIGGIGSEHQIAAAVRHSVQQSGRTNRQSLLSHPIGNILKESYKAGMSHDQALAYLSERLKENPGVLLKDLPEVIEAEQGKKPIWNERVRQRVENAAIYSGEKDVRGSALINRNTKANANLHDLIHPWFKGENPKQIDYTVHGINELAKKTGENARNHVMSKVEPSTIDTKNKTRTIPGSSMIVDVNGEMRRMLYSPDLVKAMSSSDVTSPAEHLITPSTHREDITSLPVITRELAREFSRLGPINWDYTEPSGLIRHYEAVGLGHGGVIVKSNVRGATDSKHLDVTLLGRREFENLVPEVKRDDYVNKIANALDKAGTDWVDAPSRIKYNTSDFDTSKIDPQEFPSRVYMGGGGVEGRGDRPARLIDKNRDHYSYQLPTGELVRVATAAVPEERRNDPVLPPTDVLMRRVNVTGYEQPIVQQVVDIRDGKRTNMEVQVGDNPEDVRRIYLNDTDRRWYHDAFEQYAVERAKAQQNAEDPTIVDSKWEDIFKNYALSHSRTGEEANSYKYLGTEQTIHKGDIVYVNAARQGQSARRLNRLPDGPTRAVVVDSDIHGVHIKLANDLEGHTTLAHPETLIPIPELGVMHERFNPGGESHAESMTVNPLTAAETAAAETAPSSGSVPAPSVSTSETETAESPELTAAHEMAKFATALHTGISFGREQTTKFVETLQNVASVEEATAKFNELINDPSSSAIDLKNGVISAIASSDGLQQLHIINGILASAPQPGDGVDTIEQVIRHNEILKGVNEFLDTQESPIDYTADWAVHGSEAAPVARRRTAAQIAAQTGSLNSIAQHALATWSAGTLETHVRNVVNKLHLGDPEAARVLQTSVISRARQMSHVLPQVAADIMFLGPKGDQLWSLIPRMSHDQQRAASSVIKGLAMQPRESRTGDVAMSIDRLNFQDVKSQIQQRLAEKGLTHDIPTRVSHTTLKRGEYAEMVHDAIRTQRRNNEAVLVENTVARASKPDTPIAAIQYTLGQTSISAADKERVLNEFGKNASKDELITFLANTRFAKDNKLSVGEVSKAINSGDIGNLSNFINDMGTAAQTLTRQISRTDPASIVDTLFGSFSSDDFEGSPLARYVDENQERIGKLLNNTPEDDLPYVVADEVNKLIKFVAGMSGDNAVRAWAAGNGIARRVVYSTMDPTAATYIAKLMKAQALIEPQVQEVTEGAIPAGGRPSRLTELLQAIDAENISAIGPSATVTQADIDYARQLMKQHNDWRDTYETRQMRDIIWKLPSIDYATGTGAAPPPGTLKSDATSSVSYETDANGNKQVVITQKNPLNKTGMQAQMVRMLLPENSEKGQSVTATMAREISASLADIWDMQAFAYADRHVNYEMRFGNSPDALEYYRNMIGILQTLSTTQERKDAFGNILAHINQTGGSFLTEVSPRGGTSIFDTEFGKINDAEFGRKAASWIVENRRAQLVKDFYGTNARMSMSAIDPSRVSAASPFRGSFGSIHAHGTPSVPSAAKRGVVQMLLNINRAANAGRNALSLAHEVHHGLFHTMPYGTKLDIALDALNPLVQGLRKGHIKQQNDLLTAHALVSAAKTALVDREKQLDISVSNAIDNYKLSPTAENFEAVQKANQAKREFQFENYVDVHSSTDDVLYTSPIINEAAATHLMNLSLTGPIIQDKGDGAIGYVPTGILTALGNRITQAIGIMNQADGSTADYQYSRSGNLVSQNANWTLPAHTFMGDGPSNTLLLQNNWILRLRHDDQTVNSMIPIRKRLDSDVPDFIPVEYKQRDDRPPLSKIKGGPLLFNGTKGRYRDMPLRVVAAVFAPESGYTASFKNPMAATNLPGERVWYRFDSDGKTNNFVQGDKTIDPARVNVGYVVESGDHTFIVRAKDIDSMARVSGNSGPSNPNVRSLLYSIWGRLGVHSASVAGKSDARNHQAMKQFAYLADIDASRMPSENKGNMVAGAEAYGDTADAKAKQQSGIDTSTQTLANASTIEQDLASNWEHIYTSAKNNANDETVNNIKGQIDAVRSGLEQLTTSVFGIDDVTRSPISIANQTVNTIGVHQKGEAEISQMRNMLPTKFRTDPTIGGPTSVVERIHSSLAQRLKDGFAHDKELLSDIGHMLATSDTVGDFYSKLLTSKHKEYVDLFVNDIFPASTHADAVKDFGTYNPSDESMFGVLRDIARGSLAFGHKIGDLETPFNVSNFKQDLNNFATGHASHEYNQRAVLLNAADAYAKFLQKQGQDASVSSVLKDCNNPNSDAFKHVSMYANAIDTDAGYRAFASREWQNWELVDVASGTSKTPYVIMRHKGAAGRFAGSAGDIAAPSTGEMHVAVNPRTGSVLLASQVNGQWVFKNSRNFNLNTANNNSQRNLARQTVTPPQWMVAKYDNNDKASRVHTHVFKVKDVDTSNSHEHALSDLTDVLATHNSQDNLRTLHEAIDRTMSTGETQHITIPLPHKYGWNEYGVFDPDNKYGSFMHVIDAATAGKNAEGINKPDGYALRDLRIEKTNNGIKIYDDGIYGFSPDRFRRKLGAFTEDTNATIPIDVPEVHIAKLLATKDVLLGEDGPNIVSKATQENPVFVDKKNLSAPWGKGLYSEGLQPSQMGTSLADSILSVTDLEANKLGETIASMERDDLETPNAVHDPTLEPTQTVMHFNQDGGYQVRAGSKALEAMRTTGNFLTYSYHNLNSIIRVLKLGRDIGVAGNQVYQLANWIETIDSMGGAMRNKDGLKPGSALMALSSLPGLAAWNVPDIVKMVKGDQNPLLRSSGTAFGDMYAHFMMDKTLNIEPDLDLEKLKGLGLDLKYMTHYDSYHAALMDNPNLKPTDIPLDMRYNEIYGNGEWGRLIPGQTSTERVNALYRDLAVLGAMQEHWRVSKRMLPPEGVRMGVEEYRQRYLQDAAQAINFIAGTAMGSRSDNKLIGNAQHLVNDIFVSAPYQRRNMLQTPGLGRTIYAGKNAINKVATSMGFEPIANTALERKLFNDMSEGGFHPEVKKWMRKRWIQGFVAAHSASLVTTGVKMLAAIQLAKQFGNQLDLSVEWDDLDDSAGIVRFTGFDGKKYSMVLPGGIGKQVRFAGKMAAMATRHAAPSEYLDFMYKQFVTNVLSPVINVGQELATGRTFDSKGAFETHPGYHELIKHAKNGDIDLFPLQSYFPYSQQLINMMPDDASRFAIDLLTNVGVGDVFKEYEKMTELNIDSALSSKTTADDLKGYSMLPFLLNSTGLNVTPYNENYEKYLNAPYNNGKSLRSQRRDAAQNRVYKNASDVTKEHGLLSLLTGVPSTVKD